METLQEDVTLSESMLWPLIEAFYGEKGPDAFLETPYYPTNNAFLAETYAELIVAFYADQADELDPDHPVYILEWAAGAGVLAYLVVRRVEQLWRQDTRLRRIRWVYVLTDFTERNLHSWQADEQFQEWFARGLLDAAVVRPEEEPEIHLLRSQNTLKPGALANPPIVLANYFFDSIRQDFFRTEKGTLHEARIKVRRTALPDRDAPGALLAKLELRERWVPLRHPRTYYGVPRIDAALNALVRADADATFLFPIGGLRALEKLHSLSEGRFGLLCADKGFRRPEFTAGHQSLVYTPHTGSFSFMVNFPALQAYLTSLGGATHLSPEHLPLSTLAATTVPFPEGGAFHRLARVLLSDAALPQAGFHLDRLLESHHAGEAILPLETWRALVGAVRLARFDAWVFQRCGETLASLYSKDEYTMRTDLPNLLAEVEARLHRRAVGAAEALRHLRRLHFLAGTTEDCLRLNRRFAAWFGEDRDTHFYPAAVAELRGEWTAAIQGFQRAAALDPACAITAASLARVREKRGDRASF